MPSSVAKILTFTSDPLSSDLEITGPIEMVLYASSDQPDTDFFIRVSDQKPTSTIQRMVQRRLVGEVPRRRRW